MSEIVKYLHRICKAWKHDSPRPFVEYALRKISEHWNEKNIFIVEAPTGYGKSTISAVISVYSAEKNLKAIVCYPLRTLIEDQYSVFIGEREGRGPVYRREFIGRRYMNTPESRYFIRPITLTTVDTLALTLFGIPPEDFKKAVKAYEGISSSFGHYLFSWASVILSNIVLDEVHLLTDSTKSLNFFIALMRLAIRFNQKLILMSATFPDAFKEIIVKNVDNERDKEKIVFIEFSHHSARLMREITTYASFDEEFIREREGKRYDVKIHSFTGDDKIENLVHILRAEKNKFSRAIVVFNTVNDAVNFYRRLKDDETLKSYKILLLHSRFSESDKDKKSQELNELNKLREKGRYIIVSTQVIEAGIDTSSDFFVTEIAPANSLIQRLGRFLRYREDHGKIVIWYETDEKGMLKIRTFPNREPKNWILVDAHCDEVYELCRTILGQKYDNKNIVKLSEWRGKTDHVAIARPLYKVYDYELVSRTLEWLKQNVDRLKVHIPETKDGRGYKELLNDVYNIDFFKVDKERVKELERIHDHLEGPTKAIEVLLDLEGSFIREGNIINVVPNRFATEFVGKKVSEAGEFIRRYCVPVSPSVLEIWKEKLLGILYIDDEGRIERKSADRIDIQDPKTVLDPTIIAFIIDAHYDDELGLVIE